MRVVLALVLLAGCFALPDQAQDSIARKRPNSMASSRDVTASNYHVDSNVVLIHASVTDSHRRFITGLRREDFRIFENKTEQRLRYFSAEETPVSIGLVLDFSHSMSSNLGQLRDAVDQFLTTTNPEDEFCLVEFRDRAELTIGFTNAPGEIQNRVALARSSGRTALLDAVYLALRQMKKAHNARRALLIVSDGGDNHSRYSAREVENLARESDVEIYAIGSGDWGPRGRPTFEASAVASSGSSLLDEISEQGGGRYYRIDRSRDLPATAEKIGRELRHQYVLGYTSTDQVRDGRYRRVEVKVLRARGQPKLSALWRRGYYAPAD
jgi:Ca-activated chloride channel family protein